MPIKVSVDLWQLLTYSAYGVSWAAWGFLCACIWGMSQYRRGVNERPDRLTEKWREEHFQRKILQERTESQEQTIATLRMALQQAVETQESHLRLVETKQGGGR
jgi:hypothetical protein